MKPKRKTKVSSKFDSSRGWPLRCIVAGCRRQHTGPRFAFICAEHRTASAKQVRAWRTAYYQSLYDTVDRVGPALRRMLVSFGIVAKGQRSR